MFSVYNNYNKIGYTKSRLLGLASYSQVDRESSALCIKVYVFQITVTFADKSNIKSPY